MKDHLKKANIKEKLKEKTNGERWHGQLRQAGWQEQHVRSGWMLCLAVAMDLRSYPDHCWGLLGLYKQLTPTIKRCTQFTIQEQHRAMSPVGCVGNLPRLKIAHMLSGCSALAQSKYMHRKCSMESLLLRDCAGTGANWHGSSLVFACSVQTNLRVTWGTSTSSPRQTEWILNLWTTRL